MGHILLVTTAIMVFISAHALAQPVRELGINGYHGDVTCGEGRFSLDEITRRQQAAGYDAADMTQWNSSSTAPKAVVLMLHGVSMRASGMKDLASVMQSFGFDVF